MRVKEKEVKNIPNVLEADFFPRLGKDEDLARLGEALTIQLVGFEDHLRPEVPETATTPKPLVASRLLARNRTERLDPGLMLIPIEQIYALLNFFLEM